MCRVQNQESKIVFKDGSNERVIRGVITSEDAFFVAMSRRDGNIRIAKNSIIKIEEWNREGECNENSEFQRHQ